MNKDSSEEKMEEKPIICFDATELDNFQLCPFRWHAYHNLNLRPKNTPEALEMGSFLHLLLAEYYTRKMSKSITQTDLEEIIEIGRIESTNLEIGLDDVRDTIFQFREYARYYENENIIPIFVEEPFTVELYEDDNIKVLISGKPDLIFRYSHANEVNVMDHKKMSRHFDYSLLRNQFLLYATAMKTDTVIVNRVGFQKTKKPEERFLRQPFIYRKEILDEWKEDAIQSAREMLVRHEAGIYNRNRTSCEKFSGCFLQKYCSTRPSAREFLIGTEYSIGERWDVGEKLEKVK